LPFRLGFRSVEREVCREFWCGLTVLDSLDEAGIDACPSLDQMTARNEVMKLRSRLKLPIDGGGYRRAGEPAANPP
jgi:hypothetical protein